MRGGGGANTASIASTSSSAGCGSRTTCSPRTNVKSSALATHTNGCAQSAPRRRARAPRPSNARSDWSRACSSWRARSATDGRRARPHLSMRKRRPEARPASLARRRCRRGIMRACACAACGVPFESAGREGKHALADVNAGLMRKPRPAISGFGMDKSNLCFGSCALSKRRPNFYSWLCFWGAEFSIPAIQSIESAERPAGRRPAECAPRSPRHGARRPAGRRHARVHVGEHRARARPASRTLALTHTQTRYPWCCAPKTTSALTRAARVAYPVATTLAKPRAASSTALTRHTASATTTPTAAAAAPAIPTTRSVFSACNSGRVGCDSRRRKRQQQQRQRNQQRRRRHQRYKESAVTAKNVRR